MTRKFTIAATAAILATVLGTASAFADTVGPKIAACVEQRAFLTIDGKEFHLRPNEDFKVVHNAAYNLYGVTWKKRIQADSAWAHAEKVARDCIDKATGGKTANAKK